MKIILMFIIGLFLVFSCDQNTRPKECFQTLKIKSIETNKDRFYKGKGNGILINFSKNNCDELKIKFRWKKPIILLKTFGVDFWLDTEHYKCLFDDTKFYNMKINQDTIITRTINLFESKFLSEDKKLYSWSEFVQKMTSSNEVTINTGMLDNSLNENLYLSSFGRSGNVIRIIMK